MNNEILYKTIFGLMRDLQTAESHDPDTLTHERKVRWLEDGRIRHEVVLSVDVGNHFTITHTTQEFIHPDDSYKRTTLNTQKTKPA